MKRYTRQTYRLFWKHLRQYPWMLGVVLISILFATGTQTITPVFYKQFFDVLSSGDAATTEKANTLVRIILIILGINVFNQLVYRVSGYTSLRLQAKIMRDITNTCFAYLQRHSVSFFNNTFVGSLVRKVNRLVRGFEGLMDRFLWNVFTLLIRIAVILTVLAVVRPTFAVVLFVWVAIMIMINYYFARYKMKFDIEQARVDSEVTGDLADTITNNVNLKIFTGLGDEFKRFRDLTQEQFHARTKAWTWDEHMNLILSTMMILLEFAVFYLAVRFWTVGQFSIGDFVLLQAYVLTLFTQVWELSRVIRHIYELLADSEEMVEVLETPHAVTDKPRAAKLTVKRGQIEFRSVDFAYHHTRKVLRKFNLTIAPGEKVGLVGPSGSGKTTISSLLLRYYDVTAGGIYIDGKNIADVTQDSLRQHIALVPQDPILFHRGIGENILYGRRDASEREMRRAAKLSHADEFIRGLDQTYETFVGERGVKLSGGERQRVAIARAILKNAPILVLDEATSALDSESEHLIQDALAQLMKGKTTIVVAHRLSTIMHMDRIVVLKDGQIIEQGNHAALIRKKGLYSKLWNMQAGGFIE